MQPEVPTKVEGEIIWFLPSNKRQITLEHEKWPLEFEKSKKEMSIFEGKQTMTGTLIGRTKGKVIDQQLISDNSREARILKIL